MSENQIFNPDFSKVQVNFTQLEKGTYIATLGEPKAFSADQKDQATGNIIGKKTGVRFPIVVDLPETHKGGRQMITCYTHNEGGMQFSKQIIMAALGVAKGPNGEKEFDESYGAMAGGFSQDFATGGVGDVWREMKGRQIKFDADLEPNANGGMNQKMSNFQAV